MTTSPNDTSGGPPRRASFAGWEQLLGLDGTVPLIASEDDGADNNAVLYLRVSTQRQMYTARDIDADGNSIATQREVCIKRCARLKAPILKEFVEPGSSAQSIAKRSVFRELLSYVEEHPEVRYVVIYMRSRIFRNQTDAAITKRILSNMGVKLISAKEEFGEGYMADAMEAITDIMNEVQVRQSGEDIRNKMLHKAQNGGTLGRARIGYLNVRKDFDGRLVNTIDVDPDRAPLVSWAFKAYASGDYSIAKLRGELTDLGLTTRGSARWKAGPISHNQLSNLLRDPYYLGMVTYKGQVFDGRHPAIVDSDVFERVQEVLAERSRPIVRDRVHKHFLRGMMCCDRCNRDGRIHRMIYTEAKNRSGQPYGYYLCRGRQQQTCDLPHLPVKDVERAVAEEVRRLELAPDFVREMRRQVQDAVDVQQASERQMRSRLTVQLKKLESQETNLLDVAADGEMSVTAVQERLRKIAVQRRSVVDKLATSEQQAARQAQATLAYLDLLAHPYSFYVSASDSLKRKILEAFFNRVWVEDEQSGVVARVELHEPISLLHAAADEHAKSAGVATDALSGTNDNLYLRVICSSNASVVGPVGLEPTTRGLKVRCSAN
jgi:site-specific DNA recombinase